MRDRKIWFWRIVFTLNALIFAYDLGSVSGTSPSGVTVLNFIATAFLLYGLYSFAFKDDIDIVLLRVVVELSCLYVGGYRLLDLLGHLWNWSAAVGHPATFNFASVLFIAMSLVVVAGSIGGFLVLVEP
jgi:hypothetical protein